MTETEAIALIEKVCAEFRGTLLDHKMIQEAVVTIKKILEAAKAPPPPAG
jgi:F0F1-type ATP synthase delta subunit